MDKAAESRMLDKWTVFLWGIYATGKLHRTVKSSLALQQESTYRDEVNKMFAVFWVWSPVAEGGFEFLMLLRAGVTGVPYTQLHWAYNLV